ncbi:uncharacterized protein LOC131610131 [Vicia villosa]|uniref:uncharacterized protein LOC131610131 n=1 Tax=Vicia villosa TaxID=3911 RepID=UPI00273BA298|nr:uncharacterized protein LOC131610131 [Vicia villosa]
MPFTMKIQPIDSQVPAERIKPVVKSRLKRLFERQFSGVLKNPPVEKIGGDEPHARKDGNGNGNGIVEFEPSSVCLAKMVQSFIEENQEKHSVSCARNCFNGNFDDTSDTELHALGGSSSGEKYETLKDLVACPNVFERNMLAEITKIIEKNKTVCKRKDDNCRKTITDGLLTLGYDASICKSRWEKSTLCIAGEYEYIDVVMGKERVIIDVDFRSEFEIARATKSYKAILQTLPYVFVGKCDRLQSIVAIASEAAKQSLKKKGLHVPPWRKLEYVRSKWLSPYTRTTPPLFCNWPREETERKQRVLMGSGESEVRCDESESKVVVEWKPPELKPKNSQTGVKVVTGLAAVFRDNP